jgi:hypothetical protein
VTHYDVLGLRPQATADEVRRAYLREARRHHPDLVGESARREAERRMQLVNAAWAVLGDRKRRAAYDRELGEVAAATRREWQPLEPDDPDEVDPRDLIDDVAVGDAGLPGAVQLVGPLLVAGGVLAFLVGAFTAIPGLFALGAIAVVVGGLVFLALPFLAVHRSRRGERSGAAPPTDFG